jgi:hypothetical protein
MGFVFIFSLSSGTIPAVLIVHAINGVFKKFCHSTKSRNPFFLGTMPVEGEILYFAGMT